MATQALENVNAYYSASYSLMFRTMNRQGPGRSAGSPEDLQRALRRGPLSAAELVRMTGASQPVISRNLRRLGEAATTYRIQGHRTPQYALLRALPAGLVARQPIYRVLRNGSIEPFADVAFLCGGATLERAQQGGRQVTAIYAGLPPYMAFAAPSGFLGRGIAQEAARLLPLPENLRDWGDDHRIAYLFSLGANRPGNLIYGDASLRLELEVRQLRPTPASDKTAHYLEMAKSNKAAAFGSSAGGEQPKFLAMTEDTGHVIVKFARRGSRMADLLPLEQLALQSLALAGVPTSRTALLTGGDYVFLEVQRFDRVGRTGRIGMLSAGSVDDEFFGMRDSWSEFAARCVAARYLSPEDASHVDTMAAFSELIGNNDRHFENISVLIDERGEYAGIAPAYDILPMRYASIGGGLDPDLTPIAPKVGTIGARPAVWAAAAQAAQAFWRAVQAGRTATPVSRGFRQLAAANLAVAQAFVAPLLPSSSVSRA